MAIKFKNRIMFIKDTTSNEEICCWYFHGAGKKLAEVCCTSIVYTTEKKQTKVEFPDSKILEEIFVNAVLFETKDESSDASNQTLNAANLSTLATPEEENTDELLPRTPLPAINNAILINATPLNINSVASANSLTGSLVGASNSNNTSAPNNLNLASSTNNTCSNLVNSSSNIAGVNLAQLTSSSSSLVNTVNLISNSNNSQNNLRRVVGGQR